MTVYEKVITTSKPYLGPATEQFIARQCKSHLKIDAPSLTSSQLAELAKWVENSAGLIMDQAKAKELAKKIARG
jgi:hypothetical protein